jgi:hypothetical protein
VTRPCLDVDTPFAFVDRGPAGLNLFAPRETLACIEWRKFVSMLVVVKKGRTNLY